MSWSKRRLMRLGAGLGLAAMMAAAVVLPAAADPATSLDINAGTLSATGSPVTFSALDYSHSSQNTTGTESITVDDLTSSGAGWNVTVVASDLTGPAGSTAIPASGLTITTAADATADSTDPSADLTGITASGGGSALNAAVKVLSAAAGDGNGAYDQSLALSLAVPGNQLAGSYSGTITVSVNTGP